MFEIIYYTENNYCPILEFLKSIPKKDQAKILREIDLLNEFGLNLRIHHIKKMNSSDNIWELRIKHSTNNYRVFYFTLKEKNFYYLMYFIKNHRKHLKTNLNELFNIKTTTLKGVSYNES